ncbi:MAG: hypothetical protein R2727_02555 [Bacteroidales bacterium]
MTKEIGEAVYPLPTSMDVIKMLTELEVGYIIGISSPITPKGMLQAVQGRWGYTVQI